MNYIVYHKDTTIILAESELLRTAKSALTRRVNKGEVERIDYAISDGVTFYAEIERVYTKQNLMSGKDIQVRANTPCYMDPSCESYWSM